MLPLFPILPLAQIGFPPPKIVPQQPLRPPVIRREAPPELRLPTQQIIVAPQEVRPLPGQLDEIPVFNSNSPEAIYGEGILLSTFPPDGKVAASAHLNHPLQGRFDIFAHHIAKGRTPSDWQPIYQGVLIHNPSDRPITLEVLQGLSYVTNPDAPFIDLPSLVENPRGEVFSGPGSRLVTDLLRGLHHPIFPSQIVILPGESQMLFNLPIRLGNARSTLIRVQTNGPVYAASLAMPAPLVGEGTETSSKANRGHSIPQTPVPHRPPTLAEWEKLLVEGYLATPRDRAPTPPNFKSDRVIYGRVAGVARGSQWQTVLADDEGADNLTIPPVGEAFSYPLSTLSEGTFGTGQIQSAPMLVRYPDTAYAANGNYGIRYHLTLPLLNDGEESQTVAIALQTPLKEEGDANQLRFLNPPDDRVFFRGTVQIRYSDDRGILRDRLVHLVQRRGERGEVLVTLNLPPKERREVQIDFLYPPDATPPQVLTVRTLAD